MRDLWNLFRGNQPRLRSLSYAFEKAGLTLDSQPIPWCAECVLVHADIELPQHLAAGKTDFELRVSGRSVRPEGRRVVEGEENAHLVFRLPVPAKTVSADLLWRTRSLGQLALPVLS